MDRDAKLLLHGVRHGGRRERRILGAALFHEVQDGVSALVGTLGPAWAGQQAWKPRRGERCLRGVEGLAADAEGAGDFADRPAVDAMPAQHLVFHLHPIAAVEELMAREGGVLHGVRAWVERAGDAEGGDLGILGSGRASPGHDVNYNTSSVPGLVKEIITDTCVVTTKVGAVRRRPGQGWRQVWDEIRMTIWTKSP